MNKELEALEYLKPFRFEDRKAKEAYDIIKKALTPPTADEVCEALSEYFKRTVYYTNLDFDIDAGFVLQWYKNVRSIRDIKLALGTKHHLRLYRELPPHLIKLIGRFYEGEVK